MAHYAHACYMRAAMRVEERARALRRAKKRAQEIYVLPYARAPYYAEKMRAHARYEAGSALPRRKSRYPARGSMRDLLLPFLSVLLDYVIIL